ncbi:receptor kinase-like protein Xa21 [Actinidia eriantha]|uniref:receptor kinase-like protein Xa21 n=1 Tax=Actinidia eriantha TaxID=165200 RepID=UPI00258D4787|nr:receptor kinase-like protein Xa21 [Actinidia eriantha]
MLILSFNEITGEVNKSINGLARCLNSRLETLDLGYNQLEGNLPTSLGYLKDLRHLQFWRNSFKGPIRNSIGNLSVLEELDISQNEMTGSIPQSLGKLSSLIVLELSENPWEGVIIEAHFANLSSLRELSIKKCMIGAVAGAGAGVGVDHQ